MSLVVPDDNKQYQRNAVKIGCVNKSTVAFQIVSSVYLFPEHY